MRTRLALAARAVGRSFSTGRVAQNALPVGDVLPASGAAPRGHLPTVARTQPQLWASLRAQVPSAVAALGARFQLLPSSLSEEERARRLARVRVACTHPSVLDVQAAIRELPLSVAEREQLAELGEQLEHNAELAALGNALLGLIASEHFHLKFPHLPTRVLKAFVSAYVGPSTLADVGAELRVLAQGVQRWDRSAGGAHSGRAPLLSKDVAAQSVRAMIAVLFHELGMGATRNFVHSHFLSRRLDLAGLLKFRDPKRVLSETCTKYGKPSPQSRLIAETGRLSISPVFVVGVWSGRVQLGEATGSSIRMAEYRAAENALRRLYLAELPDGSFDLPSSTLDAEIAGDGPVPHALQVEPRSHEYVPQPLGRSEALHASRG